MCSYGFYMGDNNYGYFINCENHCSLALHASQNVCHSSCNNYNYTQRLEGKQYSILIIQYLQAVCDQCINNEILTTPLLSSPVVLQSTVGHGANIYAYSPAKSGEVSGI